MAVYDLSKVRSRKELWDKKPDWIVHYLVEQDEGHTHGLNRYRQTELRICNLDPVSATKILNFLGSWVAGGHGKIEDGDKIILGADPENVEFQARATRDEQGEPVLRLAWTHDP